jgi:hypothetical protein
MKKYTVILKNNTELQFKLHDIRFTPSGMSNVGPESLQSC